MWGLTIMKKTSYSITKDYSKYKYTDLEYYGLFYKNDKLRIDSKRYKKFFDLPDNLIEHRNSVYYSPSKIHRHDYFCNKFSDLLCSLKTLWLQEFRNAIEAIKTPKQIEDDVRLSYISDGIADYEEASILGTYAKMKRINKYYFVIKSLYAQFFHQMMSQIDALSLEICVVNGYKERDFSREKFDVFIQGKQEKNSLSFLDYKNYDIYNKAYKVWNFLKHNSLKAYSQLKGKYPEMIYDPESEYSNGNSAISVLKIDEKFILFVLDNLHLFFDEVCERGFKENPLRASWDYDDYFVDTVKQYIKNIYDPFDLGIL